MYSKLEGTNPDAVLINAMPNTGKEMETLYDAQDTKLGQDMAVTEAYNTFYTRLADALGRNPECLPQFLRMIHVFHYVDNVDEWPWLITTISLAAPPPQVPIESFHSCSIFTRAAPLGKTVRNQDIVTDRSRNR